MAGDEACVLQESIQQSVFAQDRHPGIGPDEEAGPKGNHDQRQEQVAMTFGRAADKPRDRIADDEADHCSQRRINDRTHEDCEIGAAETASIFVDKNAPIVIPRKAIDDLPKLVALAEAINGRMIVGAMTKAKSQRASAAISSRRNRAVGAPVARDVGWACMRAPALFAFLRLEIGDQLVDVRGPADVLKRFQLWFARRIAGRFSRCSGLRSFTVSALGFVYGKSFETSALTSGLRI
jgi:hypothetical protein